jgi:hypothetical protein
MTAHPASQPPSTAHRVATIGGQVLGIVGIVVCIALAIGVLLGRGWAVDQVNTAAASVDAQLARVPPLLADADTAVTQVQAKVTVVTDAATAVANAPSVAPALSEAFSSAVAGVSERYLPLRASYAEMHANVTSALDRLALIDRLVPAIEVPTGPVDTLADLDARVRELDASIMSVLETTSRPTPVRDAAATVATRTSDIATRLDGLHGRISEVDTRLAETRAKVASTADTASTAITGVSLLLVLVLLWIAFLHLVLFRYARAARPRPVEPAAPAVTAPA